MATTPAGWLKPRDLSARAVARRALELLGALIDEDQRDQAERFGGFAVATGDKVFWIPLTGTPWCAFADDGRVEHYCIAPDKRGGMPDGDVSTTYLLWITTDPDGFVREANVLSKTTIEWPDSDTELVTKLAEIAGPTPRPAPSRPRRPRRPRPRTSARAMPADDVRAIFERHGKTISPEVLAALTRR